MYGKVTTSAQKFLQKEFDLESVNVDWKRPQTVAHGDAATPIALQLSKKVNQSPAVIAKLLADHLSKEKEVEKAEVAGAGYVNIWFKPEVLLKELNRTRDACTAKVTRKKEAPVIVDYSSPNIAKPLGVHHILSTMIGQVIVNLHEHAGTPVVRWNYLGDWGTQYGKLAVAFEKWGKGKDAATMTLDELLALYVKFHDEAEKNPELEDEAREMFRKLEKGDEQLRTLWKQFVEITKSANNVVYQRLNVRFDTERGESYYEDAMAPIVEEGTKKGVFKKGEKGALIVEFPEESKLPPAVVVKGDGATLYLTRDLALMKDRIENYHPKAILWAVDIAQQLYFQQLFATVRLLEWDVQELEHVYFGRMRFADGAMSTRKGNIVKLEEVLDEAVERASKVIQERGDAIQTDDPKELAEIMGMGALVYGVLSQNRKMDIVFDWDKMLSFEGNSAPYLQYTHARAKAVLRKGGVEEMEFPKKVEHLSESDRSLITLLLRFEDVLDEARSMNMPHMLANYLYELCQQYNTFYNAEPILKAEEPARSLRLALTASTASVLKTGASILTLRVPDRM